VISQIGEHVADDGPQRVLVVNYKNGFVAVAIVQGGNFSARINAGHREIVNLRAGSFQLENFCLVDYLILLSAMTCDLGDFGALRGPSPLASTRIPKALIEPIPSHPKLA
jgi:hypothetical protein